MFPLLPRANEGPPRKPTGGLVRPTNYMSFSFRCRQGVPQLAKASLGPSMSCPRHRPHSALLVYLEIDLDPLLLGRPAFFSASYACAQQTRRSQGPGPTAPYAYILVPQALAHPARRLGNQRRSPNEGAGSSRNLERLFRLLKSPRPTLRFVHRPHAGNNFPSACLLPRIQVDARGG